MKRPCESTTIAHIASDAQSRLRWVKTPRALCGVLLNADPADASTWANPGLPVCRDCVTLAPPEWFINPETAGLAVTP